MPDGTRSAGEGRAARGIGSGGIVSKSDVVWCLALSVGLAVALAVALAIGFALVGYEHEPSVPPQTAVSTYVGPGDGR